MPGMPQKTRRGTQPAVWRMAVLCLGMLFLLHTGCYHYRIAGENVAPATEPTRDTLWSSMWGLRQQNIETDNKCLGNPLAEVTTSNNFGYALLTVVSLGFVAPVQVEWRCAKDQPPGGRGNVGDDF